MVSRSKFFIYLVLYFSFCLYGCKTDLQKAKEDTLFKLTSSAETGITFTNKVTDTKDFNLFTYRNFYNGGGVAIGDINNDGLPDIFFTSNQQKNKLYLNKGNWKFEDISVAAGIEGIHKWHTGVTMADIDGDTWLDIYISNSGGIEGDDKANELYINQRNGTFKEAAHQYGLDDKGLSTQAAFFDYDHDGDLDCYVLNNSYRPIESFGYDPNMRNIRSESGGDKLYRNDKGKFKDVSEEAGIYGSEIGFGLGITVGDVNNDGWDDIYISNDFFERDYLYINQKNGTFAEKIKESTGHISQASMGSDMTDINNDGYLDIFTTDMLPEGDARLKTTTKFDDYDVYNAKLQNDFHHQFATNCLQLNNGDGTFSEIAQYAGVSATDWSWGALGFDFDNDGWKDLFVSNGIARDLTDQDFGDYFASDKVMSAARAGKYDYSDLLKKMPSTPISNYGFLNKHDLTFQNATDALGLGKPSFSNGAAYGDLDNDGDQDLVINNENMEAFVYRNTASETLKNHFLKLTLKGSGQNTFGFGARVTIHLEGNKQVLQQMPSRGFESSVEPVLNFGLGKANSIDSLVVLWPNMKQQVLYSLKVDTTLMLNQQEAKTTFAINISTRAAYFTNVTNQNIKGRTEHHENNYIDFNVERLIPKMLSSEGPRLAVADVNHDGLEDFFMGGATGDTAKLFLQMPDGNFMEKRQFIFERDKDSEDIGAVFFDADGDSDKDLVVVSGGNQFLPGAIELQPRLYLNDNEGNFVRAFAGWPPISINASCVEAFDYDNDGDTDIFIGGRSIPGAYGLTPQSVLLQNNGKGNFIDVSKTIGASLASLGMVTDAKWCNIDVDNANELIVVGDWMPVTILKYHQGTFKKSGEIKNSSGWWNCLTTADIDLDGDIDLIAGNTGLNTKNKASETQPATLYAGDFDNNGQTECLQVYYKTDGKPYPFNLRGDLVTQLPLLKKKFLRHDSYAGKSVEDILDKSQIEKATKLTVNETRSCLFRNDGKGFFAKESLPFMAQLAPVFSILVSDLNKDGIKDIFLAGNFYGLKPEVGRHDASYGVCFLGSAANTWRYIPPTQSGLWVKGEARDIEEIDTKKGKAIIVARNHESLMLFHTNGGLR